MTEVSTELAIPGIGALVNLDDEDSCAQALADVRSLESMLKEAKGVLTEALSVRSQIAGSKTLHLVGGRQVEVRGGEETVYDAEEIEAELREAGMPEERIREIVVETTSYKVSAVEAKRAAAANPAYGIVIHRHSRVVPKTTYVSLKGFGV